MVWQFRKLANVTLAFGVLSASAIRAEDGVKEDALAIVKKHETASNAKAAREKIKSMHSVGTFELPAQGLKAPLNIYAAKPNKFLLKINIEGFGEVSKGFDGKVAWSVNPQAGATLVTGKELEELKDQADFIAELSKPGSLKAASVVGKETFEGKECHKLKLVRKTGRESNEFFDVKTGFLVGSQGSRATPMGDMEITVVHDNFKKFGDMTASTKTTQKIGEIEQIFNIEKIEFDKVDDKTFDLPDEIKALVDKK